MGGCRRPCRRRGKRARRAQTYGLPSEQSVYLPTLVANRQGEATAKCLAAVLGTERVLVSHDRFCTRVPPPFRARSQCAWALPLSR